MRQQRHGWTIVTSICAGAVFLSVAGGAEPASAQTEVGTVAIATGVADTERGKAAPRQPLAVGAPIMAEDRIHTGPDSQVTIVFRDDSVIDIGPDSAVVVSQFAAGDEARGPVLLRLERGKLRATVSDAYAESGMRFEVETPTAVVRLHGAAVITYSPQREVTDVLGVDRDTEVAGTISVIGSAVQVHPQEVCRVSRGRLPSPPERVERRVVADYTAGLGAVGSGTRDTLDLGNAVVAGQLPAAEDRPSPGGAPVSPPSAQAPTLTLRVPAQTLAQQLFPDNWIIEQPIPEYLVSRPDIAPPSP